MQLAVKGSIRKAVVVRSSRSRSNVEKLAAKVKGLVDEIFSAYEQGVKKLRELRPLLAELRGHFMRLESDEKIAGCHSWSDYCQRVLHRTDRRIRQVIEGINPASEKHSPKSLASKRRLRAAKGSAVNVPDDEPSEPWTRDVVVNACFDHDYAIFEKANLPDALHNDALAGLILRLQSEIGLDVFRRGESSAKT